jgi:arylsulfatase A-like enzyme
MAKRPNIVIFNPDSYRGEVLGHLGNPAAVTPNLDRLAETDAVSFSNAFSQSTFCTPSRCAFMTGWYPHVRGHRTLRHLIQPDEPMLLKTLKDAGYFVWWGGKNDVLPGQRSLEPYCNIRYLPEPTPQLTWALDRQDEWRGASDSDTYYSFYIGKLEPTEGYPFYYDYDWGWTLGAVEFIHNAPDDRPLCIYMPLEYPHPPFAVEEPWYSAIDRSAMPPRVPTPDDWTGKPSILKGLYRNQNLGSWTDDRWTELRATYYGMCSRIDHQFGMVLAALRDKGIYDQTAIFFFADHGIYLGEYGLTERAQNTFEDGLVHVPLVVKPPAGVPTIPGIRDSLVELIDVPATIEALADLPRGHDHFGRSLLPVIAGQTDIHRDAVFAEGGRRHEETHCTEYPSNPDLNPAKLYWPRHALQRSQGPEHTKAVMVRTAEFKYVLRLYESDELYDLKQDPGELHNLIDDPSLADTARRMRDRLLRFYLETADVVPLSYDARDTPTFTRPMHWPEWPSA